jgi:hypothetical protein
VCRETLPLCLCWDTDLFGPHFNRTMPTCGRCNERRAVCFRDEAPWVGDPGRPAVCGQCAIEIDEWRLEKSLALAGRLNMAGTDARAAARQSWRDHRERLVQADRDAHRVTLSRAEWTAMVDANHVEAQAERTERLRREMARAKSENARRRIRRQARDYGVTL